MAKLTTAERNKIPDSKFAGKGRTFPIEDKKHAKAAMMLSGKAPPGERAAIKAKAEKFLGAPMSKVMAKKRG